MSRSPLLEIIRSRIAQDGPMDMAEYMELCLGHPEHGYYMTRDPFGRNGDFTTAPEISQLFGEMIGVWLADLWIKFGRPSSFILLEVGPGRGTLMADILRATKRVDGFHAAVQVRLMEMSPVLREVQKRTLSVYDTRWIDGVTQLDSGVPVFVVGNEFLDALPVRQFEFRDGALWEKMVEVGADNSLQSGLMAADLSAFQDAPSSILANKNGDIVEISSALNQFIKSIDNLILKQGGAALFLDYGHAKAAVGDSLQAVKNHQYISIFDTPGSCDITAHVDFENIVRLAKEGGVSVHGPVTQRAFLQGLGIDARARALTDGANDAQTEMVLSGLKRLIDTDQMGILFKVIALCHDPEIIPAGFHEGL